MRDATGDRTRYWLTISYGDGYWDKVMWSDDCNKILNAWIRRCTEDVRYEIACNIKAF